MPKARRTLPKSAAVAASPAEPQPQIRAFPIFDDVPSGHFVWCADDRNEPHLHEGEWVVVDATDRSIAFGELYLILQSKGPRLWQITRVDETKIKIRGSTEPHAWLQPLAHLRLQADGSVHKRMPYNLSDGPYGISDLAPDILGRIVGLIDPYERMMRSYRANVLKAAEKERDEKLRRQSGTGIPL
jgi:hypothetical protein